MAESEDPNAVPTAPGAQQAQSPSKPRTGAKTPSLQSEWTGAILRRPKAPVIDPEPVEGLGEPKTKVVIRGSDRDREANAVETTHKAKTVRKPKPAGRPAVSDQTPSQRADLTSEPRDNQRRAGYGPESEAGVTEPVTTTAAQASEVERIAQSAESGLTPESPRQLKAAGTREPVEEPPTDRHQLTREIQRTLKTLGYEPGPIDSMYGPKTKGDYIPKSQFDRVKPVTTSPRGRN